MNFEVQIIIHLNINVNYNTPTYTLEMLIWKIEAHTSAEWGIQQVRD